jgi:hypothetical protein
MIPRFTSTSDAISKELYTLLVRLYGKLKHARITATVNATRINCHGSKSSEGGEMPSTLRYLRCEITVPVGRSSRESVLGQENVEEVLEGSGFSIRLRQDGWAQVSLWHGTLVPDDDYRLASRCIATDQRSSLAAGTRGLVRTLPEANCKSRVD